MSRPHGFVFSKPACLTLLALLFPAAFFVRPQTSPRSPMIEAMQAELKRSMEQLKKKPTPPYFFIYEVTETESAGAAGQLRAR